MTDGDLKLSEMTKSRPDPRMFTVLRFSVVNGWTIAEVRYPDVEHLDGIKILVFEGDVKDWLKGTTFVDPHMGIEEYAPTARFNPVKNGWSMAERFCELNLRK